MSATAPEPDFSKYKDSDNPFLRALYEGSTKPDAPDPWWRRMLRYTDEGNIDFEKCMDDKEGVPKFDKTASDEIVKEFADQIFFVAIPKRGSRGASGDFRTWNGRVWNGDLNDSMTHSMVNMFWVELGRAIDVLAKHIQSVAANRKAELIASGMAEAAARSTVQAEVIKPMTAQLNEVRSYYKKLGGARASNALIEQVTRWPMIAVTEDDFDVVEEMMVCRNVVLDFTEAARTRDIGKMFVHEHSAARRVSMWTPVDYDPAADCPLFRSYITSALPDEDVRWFLQKALGSALLGKPNEKIMLNLIGERNTGKSVLLTVMERLFGTGTGGYGATTMAATFVAQRHGKSADGPSPALHALRKAKLVVSSEPNAGDRWDAGLVKALTGRDKIVSRGLYGNFVDPWRPRFLVVLASNQYLRLSVDDTALVERIVPIPFTVPFYKTTDMPEDEIPDGHRAIENLDDLITDSDLEMSGVLNWALEGLAGYLREGLVQPEALRAKRTEMESESSLAARWFNESIADGTLILLSVADATAPIPRGATGSGAASGIPPRHKRVLVSEAWFAFLAWLAGEEIPIDDFGGGRQRFAREVAKMGGSSTGKTERLAGVGVGFDRLAWPDWASRGSDGSE